MGLGHMGLPMATNLVKAGHDVTGYDLSDEALAAFAETGGARAQSLADALADAEVVVTMLTSGKVVRQVYEGADGILSHAPDGALLIDSSTIDVDSARAVAAAAAQKGYDMVDAPVSGGVTGAEAATLAFMVGGPDSAFARAEPILSAMGRKVVHAGAPGNGQAAKICNNMLLAVSMIGVSEAFNLARALGLKDQAFFDIAANASGQCWSLTSYCPVPGPVPGSPANRDYEPGFATALMCKDLGLAQDAVASHGVDTPLGAAARQLYDAMQDSGMGDRDFSAVIRYLADHQAT